MYTTRRFWLVLIAAISGLAILACSCNSLLPSAAPTSAPILPPSPATVSAPTSEPVAHSGTTRHRSSLF